jgi:hypothetical protein
VGTQDPVSSGPIPPEVPGELEELKLRLAAMHDDDLPPGQAEAIHREISAIRLHLQRLELERVAVADAARRAARH